MAKIDKLEEARRSGIGYALYIILKAQEDGASAEKAIDKLKEEMEFRNITKVPLGVTKEAIDEYTEKMRHYCVVTYKLMTILTLHDEFRMGRARLERFLERFDDKAECLTTPNCQVDWSDYQQIMDDECGIHIELPKEFLEIFKDKE